MKKTPTTFRTRPIRNMLIRKFSFGELMIYALGFLVFMLSFDPIFLPYGRILVIPLCLYAGHKVYICNHYNNE